MSITPDTPIYCTIAGHTRNILSESGTIVFFGNIMKSLTALPPNPDLNNATGDNIQRKRGYELA